MKVELINLTEAHLITFLTVLVSSILIVIDPIVSFLQIEFDVEESCTPTGVTSSVCIDTRRTSLSLPSGGYVVYGVAHQHTGGIGSTLYGEVISLQTFVEILS